MHHFSLITTLLLALSATSAHAHDVPQLGSVKLVMIVSPNTFETLDVPAISTTACRSTNPAITQCDVEDGSSFTLNSANGQTQEYIVSRMVYFFTPAHGLQEARHEFFYTGSFHKVVDGVTITSTVDLSIQYSQSTSSKLEGYFRMSELGLNYQLVGVRSR